MYEILIDREFLDESRYSSRMSSEDFIGMFLPHKTEEDAVSLFNIYISSFYDSLNISYKDVSEAISCYEIYAGNNYVTTAGIVKMDDDKFEKWYQYNIVEFKNRIDKIEKERDLFISKYK